MLARRVSWLDRYRRAIAVATAALVSAALFTELAEQLGPDWPKVHGTLLAVVVGVVIWCVAEIGLAWLTAFWETECARLLRDRGLPRAVVRNQRKRVG
jgi:hypothetical protein